MSLALAAALGLGLGVVTGMPLGVINVAIVDAATARQARHALGLALGGALADTTHATLAFLGISQLVTAYPTWVRALAVTAAVVIAAYAVVAWRSRRGPRALVGGSLLAGIGAGLGLTLPNVGALGAWGAIAAALLPAATTAEALSVAGGVGLGSALWFALLGRIIGRVRPDHPALRHVPRLALVALVGIAIAGVARLW